MICTFVGLINVVCVDFISAIETSHVGVYWSFVKKIFKKNTYIYYIIIMYYTRELCLSQNSL